MRELRPGRGNGLSNLGSDSGPDLASWVIDPKEKSLKVRWEKKKSQMESHFNTTRYSLEALIVRKIIYHCWASNSSVGK